MFFGLVTVVGTVFRTRASNLQSKTRSAPPLRCAPQQKPCRLPDTQRGQLLTGRRRVSMEKLMSAFSRKHCSKTDTGCRVNFRRPCPGEAGSLLLPRRGLHCFFTDLWFSSILMYKCPDFSKAEDLRTNTFYEDRRE